MQSVVASIALFGAISRAAVVPRKASADPTAPLAFTSDGTFQISIFNDLHFGESKTSSRRSTA